jgi:hypothetical protein
LEDGLHQSDGKRLLNHLYSLLFDDLDLRSVLANTYELWVILSA